MKLFNTKTLLFTIFTIAASTFTLWLYILISYSPYESNYIILSAFYITFFLFFGGITSLILYFQKVKFSNHELIYEYISSSLRQGYILSFIVVISLVLKGLTILNWFEFIIIIIIGLISELYFRSKNVRKLSSNN